MSSILSKSGKDIEALAKTGKIVLEEKSELGLAMQVLSLTYVLEQVRNELQLLPLCQWLRDLCVEFSTFVRECRVLNHEKEESRLLVVHACAKSMRQVMGLLGMEVVQRL